jgi:outer membrane receptor protein involved in Fe transport
MYGRTLPTPVGTGEDYGVKFSLLGGRLTGTLTRYKSTQDNQAISSIQALGPRISAIGTVLNLPQLIAVTDPRDTQDVVAKGYELELIYNPTANWRLALNASRNNNVLNNVNSRAAAFLTEVIYPLETQFGAVVVPSGQTVRQEINDFRTSIRNNKTAVEGQQAELLREWNGNLVTNYRFSTGRAKGINLGGNIQYRGSAVIGSLVNPTTNLPDFANPLKGTGYTIVGVHVRYERRVFGKYDWNVSLHVRNLLDEDRLIEKSASATDGAILIYDQLEPRTWLLSTGVKF